MHYTERLYFLSFIMRLFSFALNILIFKANYKIQANKLNSTSVGIFFSNDLLTTFETETETETVSATFEMLLLWFIFKNMVEIRKTMKKYDT